MPFRKTELEDVYNGVEVSETLQAQIKLIYFNEKSSFRDKITAEAKHAKMEPVDYFMGLLFQTAIKPRYDAAVVAEKKDNEAFAQRLVARGTFKTLQRARLHIGLLDATEDEAKAIMEAEEKAKTGK